MYRAIEQVLWRFSLCQILSLPLTHMAHSNAVLQYPIFHLPSPPLPSPPLPLFSPLPSPLPFPSPPQVSFERRLEGGSATKTVQRTLFGLNPYPQKKVMTFNKMTQDFSFTVAYTGLDQMGEEERRWALVRVVGHTCNTTCSCV